jgi:signal transduction histidine kinase
VEGRTVAEVPELRDGVDGNQGFRSTATISRHVNRTYVAAYAPIEGSDWVLIQHAPANKAYQISDRSRQGFIIVVLMAMLGILGVGAIIGRNTAVSLRRLAARARDIENGNYDIELDTDRSDEIGQLYNSIGAMRDAIKEHIEDIEERNEQLLVLDRLLRHNLRNDMNVIGLRAESIKHEVDGDSAEYTAEILAKVESILDKTEKQRIITQVLSAEVEEVTIDITLAIEETLDSLQADHPELHLETDVPETAHVYGSPYLSSALTEVLENAVVHNTSETPRVSVSLTTTASSVEIQVVDNGPVIPKAGRQVLQGKQDIDPLTHSTGIGLWLVYRIVYSSGGSIEYTRDADQRNVVTLTLRVPPDA